MPQIPRDDLAHLAHLARLTMSDAELDALSTELVGILEAVAKVGEVTDAMDVAPTTHAVPLANVTRPDVVVPSLPRDAVVSGAPAAEDGRFRVPRILDED